MFITTGFKRRMVRRNGHRWIRRFIDKRYVIKPAEGENMYGLSVLSAQNKDRWENFQACQLFEKFPIERSNMLSYLLSKGKFTRLKRTSLISTMALRLYTLTVPRNYSLSLYKWSSWAEKGLPVRLIELLKGKSSRPLRIVSIRQHLLPPFTL